MTTAPKVNADRALSTQHLSWHNIRGLNLRVWFAWMFKVQFLNDICCAGFRVALTAMNRTPGEKVIKIDGVRLYGHARAGEPLH